MAIQKDFATIVREMDDLYKLRLPQANRGSGSVIKEAFINAPGAQLAFLHQSAANNAAASDIANVSGQDLDNLARNFNVYRNTGSAATGNEYFILNDNFASKQDVVVSDGTIISSKGQSSVDFKTVGRVTFFVASASIYEAEANRRRTELGNLGISNAKYLAPIPILAVLAGSDGNVGAGTITVATIPGVRAVINLNPTVGGTDGESDASLRERISLAQAKTATGTADSYKATVRDAPNIDSAFTVTGGDSLMTRDGTVFDSTGKIVQAGSGRCVDVWAKGSRLLSSDESFTYRDASAGLEGPVAIENQHILGYTNVTNTDPFALQPLTQISGVVGTESGGNFVQATEVEDDQGNILLEGNYVLMKDINANNYSIVREIATGRLRVARQLGTFNTRYTFIQSLVTSDSSNSSKGFDRLVFTSDRIAIVGENVTRGPKYNGADSFVNPGVLQINDITENVELTKELIAIGTNHFALQLKHWPLVSVTEVKHVRLGATFSFSITDASTGLIQINGKFVPQIGDYFQVTYTWEKKYINELEYSLIGDSVSWQQETYEADTRTSNVLLATRTLDTLNSLDIQPLTCTYLQTELTGILEREVATLTVKGDTAAIVEGEDSIVLESNNQAIVLKKGVSLGSVVLEDIPRDTKDIAIYKTDDVFKRNIIDSTATNTFDESTMIYSFGININLFESFFSSSDVELDFVVSYEVDKPFTFEVKQSADVGQIGRVLSVKNLTRNIDYSMLDYRIRTNINDRRAIVEETLKSNQFKLSLPANQTILQPGDRIQFKRLPFNLHWTSQTDFLNNVGDNLIPTIDTAKLTVDTTGNVKLKSATEIALAQATTQVAGTILSDIAWSGSIEMLDDVTVLAGVTLLIRPGTIIRVREKDRTGKRVKLQVDGQLLVDAGATAENPIIFTSAAATKAPGDWDGIHFTKSSYAANTADLSSLAFVEVRYATNGIHVDGSNPRIRNCRISANEERGVLYTAEFDLKTTVLRDANGNMLHWVCGPTPANALTRIPLLNNGVPIKLMTSHSKLPVGQRIPGVNYGLDDGLGADGIPGTADDGYGADGIPGTADDGYGADGFPALASAKQEIHFTSSTYTGALEVLNVARYQITITDNGGVSRVFPLTWVGDKESAWIEYVGAEETYYLVMYQNTTSYTFDSTSVITFDYAAPRDLGLLYQNIIEENGATGVAVDANAVVTIAGNTFYKNGLTGIDAENCYVFVRNNLIQEYSMAPFAFTDSVLAKVQQNNCWSSIIESETLNVPTAHAVLAQDIDAKQTVVEFIFDPSIGFRSGQIIQIGYEKMKVKAVTVKISTTALVVTRGIQETLAAVHQRGTTALVYGDRAVFIATSIPGTRCEVIPTDVHGNVLTNRKPLQMLHKSDNLFFVAATLNRAEDFWYRYRYTNPVNGVVPELSEVKVLLSRGSGLGDVAIDIFNAIHQAFSFQETNYSLDPLFPAPQFGNFELDSSSVSHKDNAVYAPEVFMFTKYLGREKFQEVKNFTASDIIAAGGSITTLPLLNDVVIESSARLDISIFVPTTATTVYAFSFDKNSKTVTLDNATPITVAGTYVVQYSKPVTLGSNLPMYNYVGVMDYIVDAKQVVDYTNFTFSRNDSGGGVVSFQFRSPDTSTGTQADLAVAAFGPTYTTSPIELLDFRTFEIQPIESQFIEFKVQVRSNWKGFDNTDASVFPVLEDMTLSLTPGADTSVYLVKSLVFRPTIDKTDCTLSLNGTNDTGILESTYKNVGSDEKINVSVFNQTTQSYTSIATASRVSLGATTVELFGNLTSSFSAPISSDVYAVNYVWVTSNDQEKVVFIEDGEQVTQKRFVNVSTITASLTKDRQTILPDKEQISIKETSEPVSGIVYYADYEYVAPKEGEVIDVSFTYNDAIRTASELVQQSKDVLADVLVREVLEVPIRIEMQLKVLVTSIRENVEAAVSVALANYFDLLPIGTVTTLDSSDIITVVGNVDGVDGVVLTIFDFDPLSGLQTSLTLNRNETPILATGSPVFSNPTDTANVG